MACFEMWMVCMIFFLRKRFFFDYCGDGWCCFLEGWRCEGVLVDGDGCVVLLLEASEVW